MGYLDHIYRLLNLSNFIGIEYGNKKKRHVNISITKIQKSTILAYIIFSAAITIFLCLAFFGFDIGIESGKKRIEKIVKEYNLEEEGFPKDAMEDFVSEIKPTNLHTKDIVIVSISIFAFCTAFGIIKRYFILKIKASKPYNINIYNRDLPSNLTPAHVRLLIEDGLIDAKTLASTIKSL